MSEPLIFRDLPATFPEKDKYKRPSVIGSLLFHAFLISVVIIIPLLLPQSISERGAFGHSGVADRTAPSSATVTCGIAHCNGTASGTEAAGPHGKNVLNRALLGTTA